MAGTYAYSYLPLDFDTHEIRILKVDMVEYRDKSDITCAVEHVSLIDPGDYMALSYHWGDSSNTKNVYIGGADGTSFKMVTVTANLHDALRAVLKARTRPIRLWVDAICINQNDYKERSEQVRNMSQIYSQAADVIAWVGPSEGRDLSSKTTDELRNLPDWAEEAKFSPSQLESAVLFFSEPYWRRVWVIQEITVASKVTILYGDCTFPWEHVVALLSRLRNMESTCRKDDYKTFLKAVHLLDFRDKYAGPIGIGLLEALTWSRSALATEPRDKIFALLGVCHDGPRYVRVPNYKQSLQSIIAMMSRAMMARHKSLDLMCLKGLGTSPQPGCNLPTWSPNWPILWSGTLTIQEQYLIRDLSKHTVGSTNPILEGSTNQVLKVSAAKVGSIKNIATSMRASNWPTEPTDKTWLTQTLEFSKKSLLPENTYKDTVKVSRGIWKTLTMQERTPELSKSTGMACFGHLWLPEGRGAVEDLKLIQWIDDNVFFKIGQYTLREWSQVTWECPRTSFKPDNPLVGKPLDIGYSRNHAREALHRQSYDEYYDGEDNDDGFMEWGGLSLLDDPPASDPQNIAKRSYTANELNIFISALHRVLNCGMRLACLDCKALQVAMVHPNAQPNDEVFYIQGCSIPVVLRAQPEGGENSYAVIGGAYLHEDLREKFLSKKSDEPTAFPKTLSLY